MVLTEQLIPFVSLIGSRSISASQGAVKTGVGGGFFVELGDMANGATATITIVVTSFQPSSAASQLIVHATESDTNRANDLATLTPTIATGSSSSPPHVLSLRSIRTRGKGLTAVVVSFDQPMNRAQLQNIRIYHLVMVPKAKKGRLTVIRLASATYDPATQSVRLKLKKPVKTGVLRLTIDHSGAVSSHGTKLSGGDYVAKVPK